MVSPISDFLFLYLGKTDACGHEYGWMSEEYLACVRRAWDCIASVLQHMPEGYSFILTADHGGHLRSHGTDDPQDMTIPLCFLGPRFTPGLETDGLSIKDIAPTVARLLDVPPVPEWEGTPRC